MSRNDLYDKLLALTPKYLLRLNETAGTTGTGSVLDYSGNGYHWSPTGAAGTFGSTSLLYTVKNDLATNTCWKSNGADSGLQRLGNASGGGLAGTNANIVGTGVTVCGVIKSVLNTALDGAGPNFDTIFECRDSAGKNGFALLTNVNHSEGGGTVQSASLVMVDGSGNRSYMEFTDTGLGTTSTTGYAWWCDGLNHTWAVRARRTQTGVNNEVLDLFIDGVLQTPTSSAYNVATGAFADPSGGSWYHAVHKRYSSFHGADQYQYQTLAWYNYLLSDEQVIDINNAATYTVGNSAFGYASLGLNGGLHLTAADASTLKGQAGASIAVGTYVNKWYDNYSGSTLYAANVVNDLTNPTYLIDNCGRPAVSFDGVMQVNGGSPQPSLGIAAGQMTTFANRLTMLVAMQVSAPTVASLGNPTNVLRISDSGATVYYGLMLSSNRPALYMGSTICPATGTTCPVPACTPSVGVFGFSCGAGGTLNDYTVMCNGVETTGSHTLLNGVYGTRLDGGMALGVDTTNTQGVVPGLYHEVIAPSKPWHPIERARLTAYLNNKWGADKYDTLCEVWGTSIEVGTPNSGYVVNNALWESSLPVAVQRRIQIRNASVGGVISGPMVKNDGTGNTGTGSTLNLIDVQHPDYTMWSNGGDRNPAIDKAHVAIMEPFTNDIGHYADGDLSSQSIAHYLSIRASIRARSPRAKFLLILPPADWVAGLGSGTATAAYNAIVAYFAAHPETYDSLVTINSGLTGWVHPTPADYVTIGQQVGVKMQTLMPPTTFTPMRNRYQ